MRLINALKADIKFQLRYGFYLVYVVITLVYLIILSFVPGKALGIVTPVIIYSDPSILGLFFIGGIIMLEKGQGVLSVMVVSPLRSSEYLLSKVISLAMVSVLAGSAIAVAGFDGSLNWFILIPALILTSGMFTMLGIVISAGCANVNTYFMKMIPVMILLALPCMSLIGFKGSLFFTIIPPVAALRLMMSAFEPIPFSGVAALVLYTAVMNYLCFLWTVRVFERKIIFQE